MTTECLLHGTYTHTNENEKLCVLTWALLDECCGGAIKMFEKLENTLFELEMVTKDIGGRVFT